MPVAAIAAVASAGAGLIGSSMQAGAAKDAANAQANAAKAGQQLQYQEFQQTQQNLSPWMNTGQGALQQLAMLYGLGPGGNGTPNTGAMMSALQNFPGYQFAMQQGTQALDRTAASRGLTLSGAQLKDSQQFGQGLATSTFGNYVSGLQGLSGAGQNAASGIGSAGQNYANASSQLGLAAGQAQASGIVGQANAWSSGLQGALNNGLMAYNMFGGGGMQAPTIGNTYSPISDPWANVSTGLQDTTSGLSTDLPFFG